MSLVGIPIFQHPKRLKRLCDTLYFSAKRADFAASLRFPSAMDDILRPVETNKSSSSCRPDMTFVTKLFRAMIDGVTGHATWWRDGMSSPDFSLDEKPVPILPKPVADCTSAFLAKEVTDRGAKGKDRPVERNDGSEERENEQDMTENVPEVPNEDQQDIDVVTISDDENSSGVNETQRGNSLARMTNSEAIPAHTYPLNGPSMEMNWDLTRESTPDLVIQLSGSNSLNASAAASPVAGAGSPSCSLLNNVLDSHVVDNCEATAASHWMDDDLIQFFDEIAST